MEDLKKKVVDVIGNVGKASGERELGVDPASGNKIFARIGPFGPMVQLGEKQEDEEAPKPKFASLLKGQTIQTITMDEALDLFKLPRTVRRVGRQRSCCFCWKIWSLFEV